MKTLLLLLAACGAMAQTPYIVTSNSESNTETLSGGNFSNGGIYTMKLPGWSVGGTTLAVFFSSGVATGSTCAYSVADDQSNTYTAGPTSTDSTNTRFAYAFYAPNTTAFVHRIYITNSCGAAVIYFSPIVVEISNVAVSPADGAGNGHAVGTASTTLTAGSITPGTNGDILFMYVANTTATTTLYSPGSQSGITWALLRADTNRVGQALQWGVQATAAAINPTMSMAGSGSGYVAVTMAFKPAYSGNTPPPGIRIVGSQHETLVSGLSSTPTFQFPCSGNLIVGGFIFGGGDITAVSDTNGNTWTIETPVTVSGSYGQFIHAPAANTTLSCSNNMTVTVTLSGTASNGTLVLWDLINSQRNALDQAVVSNNGNQTSTGSTLSTVSITPTTGEGIAFSLVGLDQNTATELTSPTNGLSESAYYTGENISGPTYADENDGFGNMRYRSTAALSYIWSLSSNSLAVDLWFAQAIAFRGLTLRPADTVGLTVH